MPNSCSNNEKPDMENLAIKIVEKLKWLGSFGGEESGGVTRLLYTKEWKNAQHALQQWMEMEGLVTHFDEVGNLSGVLKGVKPTETILTGSHVDTVVNGGLYDGQYGIVAGILAIKHLKEQYGQPSKSLEVISFAEEEGSRFPYAYWGSTNVLGLARREDVESIVDLNGFSFEKEMRESGFCFRDALKEPRQDLKAFVELHVEQGNVLETEEKSVGIVHSIVGQRRFTIEVIGEANHAGTTPMGYRKDAVFAASQMIYELVQTANNMGDPLVLTVGRIDVQPNIVNVMPGKVAFTIDLRHTNKESILQFTEIITANVSDNARKHNVETSIDMWLDVSPVQMDSTVVKVIEKQCKEMSLNYKLMHSGAGHDAQVFAEKIPTAMIFVPSSGGVSHNPAEYTKPDDLIQGLKALIGTLYELAYEK